MSDERYPNNSRYTWTKESDDLLREHYPGLGARKTSELMGRKETAVFYRAKILGLTGVKGQVSLAPSTFTCGWPAPGRTRKQKMELARLAETCRTEEQYRRGRSRILGEPLTEE